MKWFTTIYKILKGEIASTTIEEEAQMVFEGVLFEGDFVEEEDMKNLSKAEKKALKAAKRKAQKAKHKAFVLSRDNEDEEQFTETAVDIERQMEELIEKARSRKNWFILILQRESKKYNFILICNYE